MKRYFKFFLGLLVITLFCAMKGTDILPLKGVREMDIKQAVKLVQYERGKVVLFHVFATWCGPCMREFPVLDELARQYKSKGVTFIILSVDDDVKKVESFVNGLNLNFDVIHILPYKSGELSSAIKSIGGNYSGTIPFSIIYNRNGYPEQQWVGAHELQDYKKVFESLR